MLSSAVDTFQNNGARNEKIENDRKQNDPVIRQIYINVSQTRSLVGNYEHDCNLRGKPFFFIDSVKLHSSAPCVKTNKRTFYVILWHEKTNENVAHRRKTKRAHNKQT